MSLDAIPQHLERYGQEGSGCLARTGRGWCMFSGVVLLVPPSRANSLVCQKHRGFRGGYPETIEPGLDDSRYHCQFGLLQRVHQRWTQVVVSLAHLECSAAATSSEPELGRQALVCCWDFGCVPVVSAVVYSQYLCSCQSGHGFCGLLLTVKIASDLREANENIGRCQSNIRLERSMGKAWSSRAGSRLDCGLERA